MTIMATCPKSAGASNLARISVLIMPSPRLMNLTRRRSVELAITLVAREVNLCAFSR